MSAPPMVFRLTRINGAKPKSPLPAASWLRSSRAATGREACFSAPTRPSFMPASVRSPTSPIMGWKWRKAGPRSMKSIWRAARAASSPGACAIPQGWRWEPKTGVLWTVVNERDGLGDETPPDYLTSVRDGGFYGWPYCYWGKTVDDRVPQDAAAG